MNIRALAISGFLLSSQALAFSVQPYIVNGTDASLTDFPSFASLYYNNGSVYQNYCGATVINSQYILTAAHCIYGDYEYMLNTYVVPGLEDKSEYPNGNNVQTARVEEFYYPDDYIDSDVKSWPNDIAILKLETPLNIASYADRINTTYNDTSYPNNGADTFVAIGHGLVEGNANGGNLLQRTTLKLVDYTKCGTAVTDKQLCFDGVETDGYKNSTCNGDSGGPVYWYDGAGTYKQIGITSFGPEKCGDPQYSATSAFTELFDYQDWIAEVISGSATAKYYVKTEGDVRSLIRRSDLSSVATTAPPVTNGGSSSGGSIGGFGLMLLSMLMVFTRRKV